MDSKLKKYKGFYRAYINNIIIFNNNKKNHIYYILLILKYLEKIRFHILPKKFFYKFKLIYLFNFNINK